MFVCSSIGLCLGLVGRVKRVLLIVCSFVHRVFRVCMCVCYICIDTEPRAAEKKLCCMHGLH